MSLTGKMTFELEHDGSKHHFVLPTRGRDLLTRLRAVVYGVTGVQRKLYAQIDYNRRYLADETDLAYAIDAQERRNEAALVQITFEEEDSKQESMLYVAKRLLCMADDIESLDETVDRMVAAAAAGGGDGAWLFDEIVEKLEAQLVVAFESSDRAQKQTFTYAVARIFQLVNETKTKPLFGAVAGRAFIARVRGLLGRLVGHEMDARKPAAGDFAEVEIVVKKVDKDGAEETVELKDEEKVEDEMKTGDNSEEKEADSNSDGSDYDMIYS